MFRKFYATKKTVNNGLRLELNTPFDFQLLTIKYHVLADKKMCFEIHHYL